MKGIDRLSVIRHKSEINKDWKHKDLFRLLRKNDIWTLAYENIKTNKSKTFRIIKENLGKINQSKLQKLRDKVLNESYQFQAVKKIEIQKLNGKTRSLGLSIVNDQIVQEVIHLILEAIYEPCFSKHSFGFRPGLGTHDALEQVELKFCCVNWVIKSDSPDPALIVNQKQLCAILSEKIDDSRFMNLIRKSLKCCNLGQKQFTRSNLGVSHNPLLLPIFVNIYYHELDKWVKKKVERINKPLKNQCNLDCKQLSSNIKKIDKQMQTLKKESEEYKNLLKKLNILKRKQINIPNLVHKRIQMEYVRYANDWMIGIRGDKILAHQLKVEVSKFMDVRLKQTPNPGKLILINLQVGKANFLEYEIYLPRNQQLKTYIDSNTRTRRRSNLQLRFDIPLDSILKKMEKRGYIKKLVKGYRPISKGSYTILEDIVIVKHFTKVWSSLQNFYSGCTNLSKLQYIQSLLQVSCAMTLAHRHNSSIRKIFTKHGKTLMVSKGNNTFSFPYKTKWTIKNRIWLNKRQFIDPFKIYENRFSHS